MVKLSSRKKLRAFRKNWMAKREQSLESEVGVCKN
jgi:hypothetical protein